MKMLDNPMKDGKVACWEAMDKLASSVKATFEVLMF